MSIFLSLGKQNQCKICMHVCICVCTYPYMYSYRCNYVFIHTYGPTHRENNLLQRVHSLIVSSQIHREDCQEGQPKTLRHKLKLVLPAEFLQASLSPAPKAFAPIESAPPRLSRIIFLA